MIRSVAFYLPQYHPTPENDRFWGTGYTDWVRVSQGEPLFRGHAQPQIPADLGFYDLRVPETRALQADLAREHRVDAFCYYHYWFRGRRLLAAPFDAVLESGEPDFPFLLCWANENWTRVWDGRDREVIVRQEYSEADDRDHAEWLVSAFADRRYVRLDGRPVFLVYRATSLPAPRRTTDLWRQTVVDAGLPEPYLCRVESAPSEIGDPEALGFDAAVEFQPDWLTLGQPSLARIARAALRARGVPRVKVYDYKAVVDRMLAKPTAPYRRFPCVMPSWDNSVRRSTFATVLHPQSVSTYESWLREAKSRAVLAGGEQLLFINAWNEWAEGAHLEPDTRVGRGWLEATAKALQT